MTEAIYENSELILRFLKQELNGEEKVRLQQWAASSPQHALLLEELQQLGTRDQYLSLIASIETGAARERLAGRLFEEKEVGVGRPVHRVHLPK